MVAETQKCPFSPCVCWFGALRPPVLRAPAHFIFPKCVDSHVSLEPARGFASVRITGSRGSRGAERRERISVDGDRVCVVTSNRSQAGQTLGARESSGRSTELPRRTGWGGSGNLGSGRSPGDGGLSYVCHPTVFTCVTLLQSQGPYCACLDPGRVPPPGASAQGREAGKRVPAGSRMTFSIWERSPASDAG